jgi:tetratricopeptide (TPR) repeat protein
VRRCRQKVAAFCTAALIAVFVSGGAIATDSSSVTASACSIAARGNASNNTLTCNFGLTPEQLREVTKAAVEGATEPLIGRIEGISKRLGITEEAAKTLLRIVGEQTDVPDERLAETLTKVANDYKRLQAQVAALNPDNPAARDLVERAKSEIDDGHFAAAHQLLTQARQAQIAAAQQANKLAEQAQAARDSQLLGAAASAAAEGDLAMTELHYAQAADLFQEAVVLVPAGHPAQSAEYTFDFAQALLGEEHFAEAESPLKSAVQLYRDLTMNDPDRYRAALAEVLQGLGALYLKTDRLADAEKAFTEELSTWRALAARDPKAHRVELAANLGALGALYLKTDRLADAEKTYTEEVSIWRALGARDFEEQEDQLAETLDSLGVLYERTNRPAEAEKALGEALTMFRDLAARKPDADRYDLAVTLIHIGVLYRATGRPTEAVKVFMEALTVVHEAMQERAAHWADLATLLDDLAKYFEGIETDRLSQVENVYREAVVIWRDLAARDTDAYGRDFAAILNKLGVFYTSSRRPAEAEKGFTEAVTVWRDFLARHPNASADEMAFILANLGSLYADTGRPVDAKRALSKALAIFRDVDPHGYSPYVESLTKQLHKLDTEVWNIIGLLLIVKRLGIRAWLKVGYIRCSVTSTTRELKTRDGLRK